MSEPLITATELGKRFKIYDKPSGRLAEWLSLGKSVHHRDFWALQDFSFDVHRGDCIGIIGANGAGKSTLLRILSSTLAASKGTFAVNGRLLSLLELGTGFNPNLSGRLNVLHTAELLGYSPAYIAERLATIESFAELGEFFELPLRMYSSGMQLRLGFSMFAALDPEILVVDEALAVGDAAFQRKCFRHMEQMVADGSRAVILVAHDMISIQRLCSRVIWLDHGKVKMQGEPKPVVEAYMKFMFTGQGPDITSEHAATEVADSFVSTAESATSVAALGSTSDTPRLANWERVQDKIPTENILTKSNAAVSYPGPQAEITTAWIENAAGCTTASAAVDQPLSICYAVRFKDAVPHPVFGVRVSTIRGEILVATNTLMMDRPVPAYDADQTEIICWPLSPGLAVGDYFISCGVSTVESPYEFLVREVDAYQFSIVGQSRSGALCSLASPPQLGSRPSAP